VASHKDRVAETRRKERRRRDDSNDEAMQIATGYAIQESGVLENYDPIGPLLIRSPEIEAQVIERLDARAEAAMHNLRAKLPIEPSFELALYLAFRGQARLAGAVYLSYWSNIIRVHDRIMAERSGIVADYKASLATDRKKAIAREFELKVAEAFKQLAAEYAADGQQIGDQSCAAVARAIKSRVDPHKSSSTYWRYGRALMKLAAKNTNQSTTPPVAADLAFVTFSELQAMLERVRNKVEIR
jgi:hypothetical protein